MHFEAFGLGLTQKWNMMEHDNFIMTIKPIKHDKYPKKAQSFLAFSFPSALNEVHQESTRSLEGVAGVLDSSVGLTSYPKKVTRPSVDP